MNSLMGKTTEVAADRAYDQTKIVLPTEVAEGGAFSCEMQISASHHWPVFVISLKDAVNRRGSIVRQCQRYGIEPIFTDAVDGRHSLPQEMEYLIDRTMALRRVGYTISDAEFACALSHHFIYRQILEEGLPGAIVLEDDAILTDAFSTFYAKKGYLAADFIQMDHSKSRVYRWGGQKKAGVSLMQLVENTVFATGYSVSSTMAQYFVEHSTPIGGVADWPCDLTPMGPLVTVPSIVKHPPFDPHTSYLQGYRLQHMPTYTKDGFFKRWKRFKTRAYWKNWWFRHILTKRVS
jgi:glycosyl transferase family 25